MSDSTEKKPRAMPKGGRKGGTVFPRISLADAIGYARKLVSKTHTASQPQDVIYSGVVGAKSGKGAVRVSSLRQYGFLTGDNQSKYSAADLAKQIVAAPPEELLALQRRAALQPTVFKKLFDTFQSDTVSKAKLKQRAADLKVHPEETGACIDLYVSSLSTAGLVSVDGDSVKHVSSLILSGDSPVDVDGADDEEGEDTEAQREESENADEDVADSDDEVERSDERDVNVTRRSSARGQPADTRPRAIFNVNVTLDSSLDTDKLQKQLELLKRFGAI